MPSFAIFTPSATTKMSLPSRSMDTCNAVVIAVPVKTNSDSIVRPLNAHKTGAASRWIGLFFRERRCEAAPAMRPR